MNDPVAAPAAPSLESLYAEAVALADRARRWFDGPGVAWRASLPVDARALVATESLATTARLMAVMSWLLDPARPGGTAARRAFLPAAEAPELPADSPLRGTPGADIAQSARALLARVSALDAGRR